MQTKLTFPLIIVVAVRGRNEAFAFDGNLQEKSNISQIS